MKFKIFTFLSFFASAVLLTCVTLPDSSSPSEQDQPQSVQTAQSDAVDVQPQERPEITERLKPLEESEPEFPLSEPAAPAEKPAVTATKAVIPTVEKKIAETATKKSEEVKSQPQETTPKTSEVSDKTPTEKYAYLEEIDMKLEDEISIQLKSLGWVFAGFKIQAVADGLRFKSRFQENGNTIFVFTAKQPGVYVLYFIYQDNINGIFDEKYLKINVISGALEPDLEVPLTTAQDYTYAESLYANKKYELALDEYLKIYNPALPLLNERIADIYYLLKSPDKAVLYWQKNLSAEAEYRDRAISGLVKSYILLNDPRALLALKGELMKVTLINTEKELLALAKYFLEQQYYQESLNLLLFFAETYPESSLMDFCLFLTAMVYEAKSSLRDYNKAYQLFIQVYSEFPESRLASTSREKAEYIKSHFLIVQ